MHQGQKLKRDTERFLWHLQPPWRERFNHTHWWKDNGKAPTAEEAAWEIFRRQPEIPKLCKWAEEQPRLIDQLAQHLSSDDFDLADFVAKGDWKRSLDPTQAVAVSTALFCTARSPSVEWMWPGFISYLVRPQHGWQPPTVRVVTADAERRPGRMLIEVDPLARGVEKAFAALVKEWRKQNERKKPQGKAHVGQWLQVISDFEAAELADSLDPKRKRDDQLFARYRRTVEGWDWPWPT